MIIRLLMILLYTFEKALGAGASYARYFGDH